MDQRGFLCIAVVWLASTTGCGHATVDGPPPQSDAGESPQAGAETSPAPIRSLNATLTPENSRIRLLLEAPKCADFADFFGTVHFGPDGRTPSDLVFELQTASLRSGVEVDPRQLMSREGLNAAQFPFAEFRSTSIRAKTHEYGGTATITGDLTIAGTKSEIAFPSGFSLLQNGTVRLSSEIRVRCADFGLSPDGPLGEAFSLLLVVREAPVAASAAGQ